MVGINPIGALFMFKEGNFAGYLKLLMIAAIVVIAGQVVVGRTIFYDTWYLVTLGAVDLAGAALAWRIFKMWRGADTKDNLSASLMSLAIVVLSIYMAIIVVATYEIEPSVYSVSRYDTSLSIGGSIFAAWIWTTGAVIIKTHVVEVVDDIYNTLKESRTMNES